jgi:hypothetical protein
MRHRPGSLPFLVGRLAWIVPALLLLVGLVRIVGTHSVFVQTYDEGAHVAAGMEWLDRGSYRYDAQHPPMRIIHAVGPYLLGRRSFGDPSLWAEGNRILYAEDLYARNLSAARMGALPFFALTCIVVWLWSRRLVGPGAALVALVLASTLPILLGHAAIATTDILVTGTFALAVLVYTGWLERPTLWRSLGLGLVLALALLSKFSAALFLVSVLAAIAGLSLLLPGPPARPRIAALRALARPQHLGSAVLAGFIVVWAGYRFSFDGIATPADRPHELIDRLLASAPALRDAAYALVEMPVPAPELVRGFAEAKTHLAVGHTSFFLGEIRDKGWVLFFPVGILVKSPIAFLLLAVVGLLFTGRRAIAERDWRLLAPGVGACVLLLVCLPVSLNIGVRHILPIFPLLAVLAGAGGAALWQWGKPTHAGPLLVGALLAWHLVASVRAHPDYLAYFNECCQAHPERVLVDSDLDWGQDLQRLADELKRRGVEDIRLAYFGTADPRRHGLPKFTPLSPGQPATGWIAISEFHLALGTGQAPYDQYRWLKAHAPVARVGKSIKLYELPDAAGPR